MTIYCAPLSGSDGSLAVYSLLRYAFNSEYGGAFPENKKTPNGKPYFPARRDIHFSLSHSRAHVLCALSGQPVGADIESPRLISERAIKFFCSPAELALFGPLEIWVLKESYIKLVGGTLAIIKNLRFSRDSGAEGRLTCTQIDVQVNSSEIHAKLYHIGDCPAAVCSLGDQPPDSVELVNGSQFRY